MTRKQWAFWIVMGAIGIALAAFFLDSIGGALGWILAGATLGGTLGPSFRALYAWSTARQLARARNRSGKR